MEKYKQIFDKIPYGIIILNKKEVIKEINGYTLKILKCSEKSLIGNNFNDIFLDENIFSYLILNQKDSRSIVFHNKFKELIEINFKIQVIDKDNIVIYLNDVINNDENRIKDQLTRKKIMIVDDEKVCRLITRKMLEELGYEVIAFSQGLEAIKFYKKHYNDIDMVLLDMVLKDISGKEIYRNIKKIHKRCNIIVLTGNDNEQVQKELNNIDINIMQKPITIQKLSEVLLKVFINEKINNNLVGSNNDLVFDYNTGVEYFDGNVELYDILLSEFIDMYQDSIKDLYQYIIKSHEKAIRLAHNLKSVSANLGANKLHKQARALELYFLNKGFNVNNLEMQELVERMNRELNNFISSIKTYFTVKTKK